jgi:hypothetical protein
MTEILNKLSVKPSTLAFVLVLFGIFVAIRLFPEEDALWIAVVVVGVRIFVDDAS